MRCKGGMRFNFCFFEVCKKHRNQFNCKTNPFELSVTSYLPFCSTSPLRIFTIMSRNCWSHFHVKHFTSSTELVRLFIPYAKEDGSVGKENQYVVFLGDLMKIRFFFAVKVGVRNPDFV